ncbi:MAG: M15 family metallopeptidase, partial [Bacilli bacterium]|nr:M15 family metallopeptidase [Bacilli bacterium]
MKKLISIFLIILIVLILILLTFHNKKKPIINYSKEAITQMKEENYYEKIKKRDYNQTVEAMLTSPYFQEKYLDNYYEITYHEKPSWSELVNIFLEKNYTSNEINNIFEYLNDENIQKLSILDYTDLGDFIKVSNLDIDKINRYKEFQNTHHTSVNETVTKVNIGLDKNFYSDITTIENPDSYTVLVNKYRALPEDYMPNDLTPLSINTSMKLRKKAAEAYEKLESAALLDQVIIIPFSAYRTKQYQNKLYTNYSIKDGALLADTYSARPRHSEHETGLAVDVRSNTLIDNLTEKDYQWMLQNSYKYGFIVRYAYATSAITGYI